MPFLFHSDIQENYKRAFVVFEHVSTIARFVLDNHVKIQPDPQKLAADQACKGYMATIADRRESYISFLYIPTVNFYTLNLIYALGPVSLFAGP